MNRSGPIEHVVNFDEPAMRLWACEVRFTFKLEQPVANFCRPDSRSWTTAAAEDPQ